MIISLALLGNVDLIWNNYKEYSEEKLTKWYTLEGMDGDVLERRGGWEEGWEGELRLECKIK